MNGLIVNNLTNEPLDFDLKSGSKIFFIGIGGISMSGLAELAAAEGFVVAGSDMNAGPRTNHLKNSGMLIFKGHDAAHIKSFSPDLIVYTAAIPESNPELMFARENQFHTIDRAAFLGWLNRQYKRVINISGTHGKTTTTAMCSLILMQSEQDPTVHLGAELIQFATTVRVGRPAELMVSEACEYKRSFLKFFSTTAAILNIDYDHVDCFDSLEDVVDTFAEFASHVPEDGYLVVPAFDQNVVSMISKTRKLIAARGRKMPELIWFGDDVDRNDELGTRPQFNWRNLNYINGLPEFDVYFNNKYYGHFKLNIPGRHNVANAVAAIACAHFHGAEPLAAETALNNFQGAEGRFTHTGTYHGATVIADYAHHPAAAAATLEAAANTKHNHIWVVFQPLTFSRTQKLFNDYVAALRDCELVLLAEIYSDRETFRDYISSADIAAEINKKGGHAEFHKSFADIRARLDEVVNEGDMILVLGPENIRALADQLTGRKDFMQKMD